MDELFEKMKKLIADKLEIDEGKIRDRKSVV
jgi:acyl carrier protein